MVKLKSTVAFNKLDVKNISNSSGIFYGTNIVCFWSSASKENLGLGDISGDNNIVYKNITIASDDDIVDFPISKKS